ncbi:MAG: glucoamylase [Methylobacteriaceae bacterium]|nr:glucoamylase [Methylobacteriaceae bacterium]
MKAPGGPGVSPTWTSSAKDMIGTAIGTSRLWFTVGYGILNEVYFPRIDLPQIRDLGFIIADDKGFWVEVKRNFDYAMTTPGPGIPAVQIVHRHERFEFTLRIVPDPDRDVLLIECNLSGDAELKAYVLLAPHVGGNGTQNSAEIFSDRDRQTLCASQGPFTLALAAADAVTQRGAWLRTSTGYVGSSDGWQDFSANGRMTSTYSATDAGNVALMGELGSRHAVLALGFAGSNESASTLAISSLLHPFERVWRIYADAWQDWHKRNVDMRSFPEEFGDEIRVSAMVLRTHQDKTYPGAMVASLSIPWGNSRDDMGGYHLVWPRDLVESAGALLTLGAQREARDILRYLIATQLADGHWSQNQWLGGNPYWQGVQLDEAAFPVLLASRLAEKDWLGGIEVCDMVRRALAFVALYGPSTDQDRWEETPGINTCTVAVAISAFVCGAPFLPDEERRAVLLLADDWNARIEEWCTAADTDLSSRYGVSRYYVRTAPQRVIEEASAIHDRVPVRNHEGMFEVDASTLVSTDPLQLVRYGLRTPDDPIMRETVTLVDAMLKTETPLGPGWHRYNDDGYGEHEDGSPFDGTGRGRIWPLLAGERGHYELAAGREAEALRLLRTMCAMSGRFGLIPEQVWDAAPIDRANLRPGRPSGSAMPLVWAHGEFIKLAASLQMHQPNDRPEQVWLRYAGKRPRITCAHWTERMPVSNMPRGRPLRLLFDRPMRVHWGRDDWQEVSDDATKPAFLGLHVAEIPAERLANVNAIRFALQDTASGRWSDGDRMIRIV